MEQVTTIDQERILLLSSRIELLFGFCSLLIPDIDLIEQAEKSSRENASFSMAAAPIFGAVGLDYEQAVFNWELRERRSKAIVELLKVLRDTDNERNIRNEKGKENNVAMQQLLKFMQ